MLQCPSFPCTTGALGHWLCHKMCSRAQPPTSGHLPPLPPKVSVRMGETVCCSGCSGHGGQSGSLATGCASGHSFPPAVRSPPFHPKVRCGRGGSAASREAPSAAGLSPSCSEWVRGQPRGAGSPEELSDSLGGALPVGPVDHRGRLHGSVRVLSSRFNGMCPTLVGPKQALVLEWEVCTLLRKGTIEVVPPSVRESGLYSLYFVVPKKDGRLCPILDLRSLNHSLKRLRFRMLTLKEVVTQIRSWDWFITLDMEDAYFHISILPAHRRFLMFAFGGEAYQYWFLPFGLTSFRRVWEGQPLTVKQFQMLLGLMAAASSVIMLGLLHMRPLQGPGSGEGGFLSGETHIIPSRSRGLGCLERPNFSVPSPRVGGSMSLHGLRLCLYTFPPVALLSGVLERVRRDRVCLLLVAPRWPGGWSHYRGSRDPSPLQSCLHEEVVHRIMVTVYIVV
ncbi:uncharacterized protein LOC125139703 [Tachysurus fulvidraco]|uniref:uncharacterized protein LOC125139703 n=1 Tax=Tachysurus fulvidraco TaxID=1234273 RepID=UPI001FF069AC|nr:uncharacterized protein LOC125139703 [Tachysurus fulvidraco]XP_047660457.1 uncharacterized protein LOC125139703 [Tachysurus fulvidraco]